MQIASEPHLFFALLNELDRPVDAVEFRPIAIAALAAGGVVFSATLYALSYAFWRQRSDTRFLFAAIACYLLLMFAAGVLQYQLALSGVWSALIVCLLVGYLISPALIWHLSAATHAEGSASSPIHGARHE